MPILLYKDAQVQHPAPAVERRIINTPNLLTAIIDFAGGPSSVPDPMHAHPHEQITYIAEGEIIFFMEGEEPRVLRQGDMFAVPSNRMHAIQLLSETARLIDSFNPVREDFL